MKRDRLPPINGENLRRYRATYGYDSRAYVRDLQRLEEAKEWGHDALCGLLTLIGCLGVLGAAVTLGAALGVLH